MTEADQPRQRESIFGLARQLVSGAVQLGRLEIQRGRQEIGEMIADTKTGAAIIGIGVAFVFAALISLDAAAVLGVAALLDAIPPLAGAIVLAAAFLLLLIGFAVAGVLNAIVVIVLLVLGAIFSLVTYWGFTAAWLAALFVVIFQLGLAGILVLRGVRRVRIGKPEETIASVKEDIAWAKRLLRRE